MIALPSANAPATGATAPGQDSGVAAAGKNEAPPSGDTSAFMNVVMEITLKHSILIGSSLITGLRSQDDE